MTWSIMQYNVKKELLWRAAHKINAQNRTAGSFVSSAWIYVSDFHCIEYHTGMLSNTLNELRVDACMHLATEWFSEVLELILLHSRLPYFKMVMTD